MGFMHPAILWGLLAASIPIIIHLIFKRRFRAVEWAAMKFLLEVVQENRRRLKLKELLLLLLRILAIVLLVLSVARPFSLEKSMARHLARENREIYVIVDDTASMSYKADKLSHFETAKEVVRDFLERLSLNDRVSLTLLSDLRGDAALAKLDQNPTNALRALGKAAEGRAAVRGIKVVEALWRTLRGEKSALKPVVLIVSDFRKPDWELDSTQAIEVGRMLDEIENKPELTLINVAGRDEPNVGVIELAADKSVIAETLEVSFRVSVKNFGATPATTAIRFWNDKSLVNSRENVSLRSGETRTEVFKQRFGTEGEVRISASVNQDNYVLDDARHLAASVVKNLDFLTVAPAPPFGRQNALADLRKIVDVRQGETGNRLSVYDTAYLPRLPEELTRLEKYSVLAVSNHNLFDDVEKRLLAQYVNNGGVLLFFCDAAAETENYSALVADGILPGELDKIEGPGRVGANGVLIKIADTALTDPAFATARADERAAPGETALVYRYWRLKEIGTDWTTLIETAQSRDPLVLRRRLGLGSVVFFAFPASPDASDVFRGNCFNFSVPFVYDLLDSLEKTGGRRQLEIGETYTLHVDDRNYSDAFRLTDPAGRESVLRPVDSKLVVERIALEGFYEIAAPAPGDFVRIFAANVNPDEGVTTNATEDDLGKFFGSVRFKYRQSSVEADFERRAGGEFWWSLALAGLLILLIETFLARYFSQ